MWQFIVAHWSFLPYLTLLGILAVMSVREPNVSSTASLIATENSGSASSEQNLETV
jgi:hypothetical protein